jgi:hypothetical protein
MMEQILLAGARTLLLILLAAIVGGCTTIYLPAAWDANPPAWTALRHSDERVYAGADINSSSGYNHNESNLQSRVHCSIGNGGSVGRWSTSGFVYGGSYDVANAQDSTQNGNKGYGGFGGFFDGNLGLSFNNVSVGLGASAGLATEFGAYKHVWDDEADNFIIPMIGVYTYINVMFADSNAIGGGLHTGFPGFLSADLQASIGSYVISTSIGAVLGSGGYRGVSRFMAGVSYRLQ